MGVNLYKNASEFWMKHCIAHWYNTSRLVISDESEFMDVSLDSVGFEICADLLKVFQAEVSEFKVNFGYFALMFC